MIRRFLFGLIAGALLFTTSRAVEPPNIYHVKQALKAYVDSGEYLRDVAAVGAEARAWLEQRAAQKKPGERLVLVLDIDETMLSNLPEMRRNDFGYIPPSWVAWVRSGQAPAIAPVLEIFRTARRLGVEVVLLTGRTEGDRPGTEANLQAAGYEGYTELHFKSDDSKETTEAFKTGWRRRIAAEGRTIIANVGDQDSDLAGGFAERTFKLPDPFYITK